MFRVIQAANDVLHKQLAMIGPAVNCAGVLVWLGHSASPKDIRVKFSADDKGKKSKPSMTR